MANDQNLKVCRYSAVGMLLEWWPLTLSKELKLVRQVSPYLGQVSLRLEEGKRQRRRHDRGKGSSINDISNFITNFLSHSPSLSKFGTDVYQRVHATSLILSASPGPPSD